MLLHPISRRRRFVKKPVAVISKNLGHTSTKMVEQHYGHLRPDFIAEQIQQHAPTFGFKIDSKVAALR